MSVLGRPLLQLRHTASPSTRTTTTLHSPFCHPFFSSSKLTLSAEPLSRLDGEHIVAGPAAFSPIGVLRSASGFVSGLGFWLKARWSCEKGEVEQLRPKQRIVDEKRREALSKILDIKGSIRVFCRIRPYMLAEKRRIYEPVSAISERIRVKLGGTRKDFEFDKVFPQEASQESVFVEVEPILRSAMDGHNVCAFAYGQTSTGKTFTMDGTNEQPGIIPRALEELFRQASMDNSSGRSCEPMTKWLQDVVHSEKRLYLVFEYLDLDLKKHMDSSPEFEKDLRQVKIFEIMDFSTPTSYGSKA